MVLLPAALLLGGCDATEPPTPPVPAAVRVAADTVRLYAGEGAVVVVSVLDEQGDPVDGAPLRWSSSDPAVAQVDSAGHVTGVRPGRAEVTVQVADVPGARAGVPVLVEPRPDRLEILPDTLTFAAPGPGCPQTAVAALFDRTGARVQAHQMPQIRFAVLDTAVAGRDPNARGGGTFALISFPAVGKRAGETRLVAAAAQYRDTSLVRVLPGAPSRVEISGELAPYFFAVGDTARLHAQVLNECSGVVAGADPAFASTNPAVVEVSPEGRMTARAAGRAWVRATWQGLADSVMATVNVYRVLPADTTVFVGDTVFYRASLADSTGVFRPWGANYSTSDPGVARVLEGGRSAEQPVVAVAPGEVQVVAEVFARATARLRVVPRP